MEGGEPTFAASVANGCSARKVGLALMGAFRDWSRLIKSSEIFGFFVVQ